MNDLKECIQILENLCVEPESGSEARLDADELDAVLFAIKYMKKHSGEDYSRSCFKCKYRNANIGNPKTETFWCEKKHYLTGAYSHCDNFESS